ncbi:MAG: substrate-binding domain-containing protein [Pseudomonadota bacterium]
MERMITWSPAAVVVSGTDGDQKARDRLRASQIPTLEIWDVADDPIDLSVGIDHLAAGRAMGSHLMSLGYRRPAYVGVERGRDPRAEKRRSGLAQAFAHHGVTWAAEERVERPPSFEAGHLGALAVLEGNTPHPDVMCFLNDHLAFGGLMACEKQAIDVPGEIGIVGFNDLNINNVLPRALTTSSTPRAKMGALGAQLLFAAIQGVRTTRRVEMSVDLVPGETTRPRLTG